MIEPTNTAFDAMVNGLCKRLTALGGNTIGGRQLATELGLRDTRTLRKLVAYARVQRHRHEIVGLPGQGYFWGPFASTQKVLRAINLSRRMGRCWFYLAALLKREGTAMAAVQMVFDFVETQPVGAHREADDLAALVASEGTSVGDVLHAFITRLAESDEGRKVLAEVGAQHAELLLPEALREEIVNALDGAKRKLLGLGKRKAI